MAQIDIGILAAVIGAVLLGSYFTPVKFSKLSTNQYVFIQLIFASLAMIAILIYTKESFNFRIQDMGFPILSGVLFAAALSLVFFSLKTIGVSKAAAIYVGLQLVVATVIGFAFFNELGPLSSIQRIETVIGIVLVLGGILLISIAKL